MKTLEKLSSEQRAKLWQAIHAATKAEFISRWTVTIGRKNFLARARKAMARNMAEPGDCKGDLPLLAGLAVAEAEIGRNPGWIPIVQKLGCEIAKLIEN